MNAILTTATPAIYQQLEKIVLPYLEAYKTDLTNHDLKTITENEGVPFVYGYRKSGTDLVLLPTSIKEWFKASFIDQLPNSKRQAIEKIKASLVDSALCIHYSNEKFLYFDGVKLIPKTKEQIVLIWLNKVNLLIARLEEINKEETFTTIF